MQGWEGVQRQGQGIADQFGSLAQGLGHVLQSHVPAGIPFIRSETGSTHSVDTSKALLNSAPNYELQYRLTHWGWNWPGSQSEIHLSRCEWVPVDRHLNKAESPTQVSTLYELGTRLGQAGTDLGACISHLVGHAVSQLPNPFHIGAGSQPKVTPTCVDVRNLGSLAESKTLDSAGGDREDASSCTGRKVLMAGPVLRGAKASDQTLPNRSEISELSHDELFAIVAKSHGQLHKQSSVTVTTTYDSRTQDIESSIVARGDLWRAEASHGGSASNGTTSPLFLLQVGPILFVRDTTLLIPVHLSKQHLLWYGFDRKNSQHSLCPAIWSKHRRWLLMSMVCLNPVTCSFMDLQFPNGQMTYVSGEGLMGSAFLPALGGLVQAQGRHPGNTKLSYSFKSRWGTRKAISLQLPDRSVSLNVTHPLIWRRSGMMYRPTIQLSMTSTFGDRNERWKGEVIHSPKEKVSWGCGCSYATELHAFATLSLGRSKRNGEHTGSSGLVLQVEAPVANFRRTSYSIQLSSGVEF